MERKPRSEENLSLEKKKPTFERKLYFFNQNPLLKENSPLTEKTFFLKKNLIKETATSKKKSFFLRNNINNFLSEKKKNNLFSFFFKKKNLC